MLIFFSELLGMHSKEKSTKVLHPCIELINLRQSVPPIKDGELSPAQVLLSKIPYLDRAKINQFSMDFAKEKHYTICLSNVGLLIPMDFDILNRLFEQERSVSHFSQELSIVLCFYVIYWVSCPVLTRTRQQFELILRSMTEISDPHFRNITRFLLREAIKISLPSIEWTQELINEIFIAFEDGDYFDSSFFSALLVIFNMSIINFPESTPKAYSILENLIKSENPCIDFSKFNSLINLIIEPLQNLDPLALHLIGLITNYFDSKELHNIISGIATSMCKTIQTFPNVCPFTPLQSDPSFASLISQLKIDFQRNISLKVFQYPCMEGLYDIYDLAEMVPPEYQDTLNGIKEALSISAESTWTLFCKGFLNDFNNFYESDYFLECLAAYLYIIRECKFKNPIEFTIAHLMNSPLFCHKQNIFMRTLPKTLNSARHWFYRNISHNSPNFLVLLFAMAESIPLIFAEFIARTWTDPLNIDALLFTQTEMVIPIFQTIQRFEAMEPSPEIEEAHNLLVIFVSEMANNSRTLNACFSSVDFIGGYFAFLFQDAIRGTVLDTISKVIQSPNQLESDAFRVGIESYLTISQQSYLAINIGLAQTIAESLEFLPGRVPYYAPLLPMMMKLAPQMGSKFYLHWVLKFFLVVVMSDDSLEISPELQGDTILAIITIDQCEPSKDTFSLLKSILMRSRTPSNTIRTPTALPIILGSFGWSKSAAKTLQWIKSLAEMNGLNNRLCHQGDVDLIIASYLCQNEHSAKVIYLGNQIRISLSDISPAIDLLATIIREESSHGIASMLIDHIANNEDYQLANFVLKSASSLSMLPRITIPFGGIKTQMKVKGFNNNELNAGFSISLVLKLDCRQMQPTDLFIINSGDVTLTAFIKNLSLVLKYESNLLKSTLYLANELPTDKAMRILLSFHCDDEERPMVYTYLNGDRLNDSLFTHFEFPQYQQAQLLIGHSDELDGRLCGVVIRLSFYPHVFDVDRDPAVKPPGEFDTMRLTNQCKSMKRRTFLTMGKLQLIQTEVSEYTAEFPEVMKRPKNFFDILSSGGYCNTLASSFLQKSFSHEYLELIISIIGVLFSNPKAQTDFMYTRAIAGFLYENPNCLSYSLYTAFAAIIERITDAQLLDEWFNMIVVNPWIWQKCDDFQVILTHLSRAIVPRYPKMFEGKLPSLVAKFRVFFDNDQPINEKLRDAYADLIVTVASQSLTIEDFNAWLKRTWVTKQRSLQIKLLNMMKLLPESIQNLELTDWHFSIFQKMIDERVPELTIAVMETLDAVLPEKVHANFIVAARRLKTVTFLDDILASMKNSPDMVSFVSNLELSPEERHRFCQNLPTVSNHMLFSDTGYWLLWPLKLAFFVDEEDQQKVCHFLASAFIRCKKPQGRFDVALAFARYISHVTDKGQNICRYLLSAASHYEGFNEEFSVHVLSGCFSLCFFNFSAPTHSEQLVSIMKQYGFVSDRLQEHKAPVKYDLSKSDLIDIFSEYSLHIGYEMRIKDGEWLDGDIGDIAIELSNRIAHRGEVYHAFMSFRAHNDESRQIFLPAADEIIQGALSRYSTQTHFYLKHIHDILVKKENEYSSLATTEVERPTISIEDYQFHNDKILRSFIDNVGKVKLSRIFCTDYCPCKIGFHRAKGRVFQKKCPFVPFFGSPCTVIRPDKRQQYSIMLGKDFIVLSPQEKSAKYIEFEVTMVSVIFLRMIEGRESGMEIFLKNGKSYLLDFGKSLNTAIIKQIIKVIPPTAKTIQKVPSMVLLSETPLVSRWTKGAISNFEYLMKLNILSGRSFNSPENYPILPGILHDANHLKELTADSIVPSLEPLKSIGEHNWSDAAYDRCVLIPQFYYLPDIADMEFVYQHRKYLESTAVSQVLHKWIDSIWGPKTRFHLHYQLFSRAHPKYAPLKRNNMKPHSLTLKLVGRSIAYAATVGKKPCFYTMTLILTDGAVYSISLESENVLSFSSSECTVKLPFTQDLVFAHSGGRVVVLSGLEYVMTILDSKVVRVDKIKTHKNCIACFDAGYVYSPSRCELMLVMDKLGEEGRIRHQARCKVACIAASSAYKTIAYATVMNELVVIDLFTGRERGTNQLPANSEIQKIVITQRWGFVVVFTKDAAFIHTINGKLLTTTVLDHGVEQVFTFSSPKGFDYIAIEDRRHVVYYFEAFRPKNRAKVAHCRNGVTDLQYDFTTGMFILWSKANTVSVVADPANLFDM